MEVKYIGTAGGQAFNFDSSYRVLAATSSGGVTTYKVAVNSTVAGTPLATTVWIKSDGTVIAVEEAGMNITGSTASSLFMGTLVAFTIEQASIAQISAYTGSHFKQSGTTTATFGPTTMTVTNYEATSLPITYTYCGTTLSLSAFALQFGTVPGTNYTLVTQLTLKGTEQTSSGSQSLDFSLTLVPVTKA